MFITPPPADYYEDNQVFFGETASMSSIDLAEGGNRHDSANSLNLESTRRPDSYYIESTSESDTGITMFVKRKTKPNTITNQPFTKRRRLAEAAALETSMDDSFMNERPDSLKKKKMIKKKANKKTAKKTTWTCHVCGSAGPEARARCACGKFIHKECKTYGVCSI